MGDIKSNNNKRIEKERSDKADFNSRHLEQIEKCNNTFIEHLKTAREKKGLRQEDMAEQLDISLPAYRKYEQGSNRKDVPYYIKSLAEAVDVSADYLVGISHMPHENFEEVIKSTGLNEESILQLRTLHKQDGGESYQGYLDFVNCFLGNSKCTSLFFDGLMPLLRSLYETTNAEYSSDRFRNVILTQLSDYIYKYVTKVVVPTYGEQYNTGNYTPIDVIDYITDDSVTSGKKKKQMKRG